MEEICRLCCSSSFVKYEIFKDLHDRVGRFLFTPLQVRLGDGLPQRVCSACYSRVLQLHHFCNEAQQVQDRLRAMLEAEEGLVKREWEPEIHYERATQTEGVWGNSNLQIKDTRFMDCATQTGEWDTSTKLETGLCSPCPPSPHSSPITSPTSTAKDILDNTCDTTSVKSEQELEDGAQPEEDPLITLEPKMVVKEHLQPIQNNESEGKKAPLEMLQTIPNHNPFQFLNHTQSPIIVLSDSDDIEDTPLTELKKIKKSLRKKENSPSRLNSKSKYNKKVCTKVGKNDSDLKIKTKEDTETGNDEEDSDSDGLEDLESLEGKARSRQSTVRPEDPYACWCCICSKTMPDQQACLQHYECHLETQESEYDAGAEAVPPLLPSSGRCPRCGKRQAAAAWPAHWASHQRSPHRCDLCRLSFAGLGDLVAHGLKYHAKDTAKKNSTHNGYYMCDLCVAKFVSMKSLVRHRLGRHSVASVLRPRCGRCAFTVARPALLELHVRRKHASQRPLCASCGKTFSSTDKLKHHLLLHSGEKPFKCQYCARRFAKSSTRRDHERTHTGEKPHVCAQCGRGFAQRSALVTHVRALHASARPHACTLCGRAFATKSLLKTHHSRPCIHKDGDSS